MTITAIVVADPTNPVEVQSWLNAHPAAVIQSVVAMGNIIQILYT